MLSTEDDVCGGGRQRPFDVGRFVRRRRHGHLRHVFLQRGAVVRLMFNVTRISIVLLELLLLLLKLLKLLLLKLLLLLLRRSLSHDNSWGNVSRFDIRARVVERHAAKVGAHPLVDHALGKVHAGPGAWHQHGRCTWIGRWPDGQNCLFLADGSDIRLDILNCRNSVRKGDVGPVAAFLHFSGSATCRTDTGVWLLFRFRGKETEISRMSIPLFTVARVCRVLGLFGAKTDGCRRLVTSSESRSVVVVVVQVTGSRVVAHRFVQADEHIAWIKDFSPPFLLGGGGPFMSKKLFSNIFFSRMTGNSLSELLAPSLFFYFSTDFRRFVYTSERAHPPKRDDVRG